ncbi:histone-lysine N-methyltransferase E(z)-like [Chironomus tepperi]|uniref:histone-lysine N-methyltransferase E(z)-like n=1 Tax=Chironomus tepperi TaxID=113505 RepID=UPI00391F4767
MSQTSSDTVPNKVDIDAFIKEESDLLKEEKNKLFKKKLEEIREKRYIQAEKPRKQYKDSLWSHTSEIFGSKKVICIGESSSSSESEENVVHRYVHCDDSYIKAPNNVIKIERENDEIIKKLVIEGRRKFPDKSGYDALIDGICDHYDLKTQAVREILDAPIESSSVVRKASSEVDDACSPTCYKIFKGEKSGILSVSDETELKLQLLSLNDDYCSAAKELNKSCSDICYLSKQIASTSTFDPQHKPKKMKMTQANMSAFLQYKKRSEQYEGLAAFYKPCNHDGECDDSCPCFKGKNYCEVFCSCGDKCRNKFHGCICKAKCDAKSCPCFAAVRECIVGQCGCKPYTTNEGTCTNMRIQSKMRKKIDIKRSKIAGFGAFAGEDILKGDFVIEYTGELISQEEADKRGKGYDESKMSYLFDLSSDYAVDGMFVGNESRFINHSETSPNCAVKTMTVLGDKRIALYAVRNIKQGEELFFDYRYNKEQKRIYFKQ